MAKRLGKWLISQLAGSAQGTLLCPAERPTLLLLRNVRRTAQPIPNNEGGANGTHPTAKSQRQVAQELVGGVGRGILGDSGAVARLGIVNLGRTG